jgi:hypothetical protein
MKEERVMTLGAARPFRIAALLLGVVAVVAAANGLDAGTSNSLAPASIDSLAPGARDSLSPLPIDSVRVPLLPNRVAVYYFHSTIRCQACISCETYARESLALFLPALRAGALEWRVFNFEEPRHTAWVERFAIDSSRLIVAEYAEGEVARWQALDDIWYLLDDPAAYRAYVQGHLRPLLEGE